MIRAVISRSFQFAGIGLAAVVLMILYGYQATVSALDQPGDPSFETNALKPLIQEEVSPVYAASVTVTVPMSVYLPLIQKPLNLSALAGHELAFVSDRDGTFNIYSLTSAGVKQLTSGSSRKFVSGWSPDGTKMLYIEWDGASTRIAVMDADGSNKKLLTDGPYDGSASWSPDGSKIAFISFREGRYRLYLMNPDGSGQTQLPVTNNLPLGIPRWSPNGKQILFNKVEAGANGYVVHNLYIVNASGSGESALTTDTIGVIINAGYEWSPNGTRIIYHRGNIDQTVSGSSEVDNIYSIDPDGGNKIQLTNSGQDRGPHWSPQRDKILFLSSRDGNSEIYAMDLDGSDQINLTNTAADESGPTWSPNGALIGYSSNGDLYMMDADGSGKTRLTSHPAEDSGAIWRPGFLD